MVINGNSKFQQWTASGALATAAWVLVLIVYCVFRGFGIEDPIIGQAFLLLTGLWVGNLTLAQGKKQAQVEKKAEHAAEKVEQLEGAIQAEVIRNDAIEERADKAHARADEAHERANKAEERADGSERRESEWSKHKDHHEGDGE